MGHLSSQQVNHLMDLRADVVREADHVRHLRLKAQSLRSIAPEQFAAIDQHLVHALEHVQVTWSLATAILASPDSAPPTS